LAEKDVGATMYSARLELKEIFIIFPVQMLIFRGAYRLDKDKIIFFHLSIRVLFSFYCKMTWMKFTLHPFSTFFT